MYLKCKNCTWSQDDFWSKDYTPLKNINNLNEKLLQDKVYDDYENLEYLIDLAGERKLVEKDEKGYYIDGISYVIGNLAKINQIISNMYIKTYEDYLKIKDTFKCPRCGGSVSLD